MKFVGETLKGIQGIQYFYIVGILIFIALFILILYRTIKIPKDDLVNYKTSILDKDEMDYKNNTII